MQEEKETTKEAARKEEEKEPLKFIRKARKPEIVTAEEWGSEPKDFPEEYIHEPQTILIHHAGVAWKEGTDPYKKLKNLQSWGMREKGWMDVPYHFIIAPDGTIFEGRDVKYRPDTNTAFDTTGYINVELEGNFEVQRASKAQLKSAAMLSAWLAQEYEMDPQEMVAHKDLADTACPGRDLYRYLHDGPLEEWTEIALVGKTPQVKLLDPLPQGPTEMIPDAK